jgi:hypothetical protein
MLILACVYSFDKEHRNLSKACSFWIIGGLCCIPGMYYTFKIIKTYIAVAEEDKLRAMNDIPRF